ncbi:MAG: hypothetical protein RL021_1707 [Bacteroidota bacterium]|jgi:glycosyltransferase involved in cell wall biosynthesis
MSRGTDTSIRLSLIIPVYNRPSEVDELLDSLCRQTVKDFEVVIVEDGSSVKCEEVVERFSSLLDLKYFYKPNSGPGQSRNYGAERASGNYVVFLDSDCVIPPAYVEVVQSRLKRDFVDAFGGPDMADKGFSDLQKAINHSMTSFLTTGGIRGGGEKLDKFYPRSFNMGFSKDVFEKTKGFSVMRFGEDIDMSIRILKCGFRTALIREAGVYHKRRTSFRQFFKQVYNSGIARINLQKRHPGSLKAVHAFPALFVVGTVLLVAAAVLIDWRFVLPLAVYAVLLFIDSSIKNKSAVVGFISIFSGFIQHFGYGTGFIAAFWKRMLFAKGEYAAFERTFYD